MRSSRLFNDFSFNIDDAYFKEVIPHIPRLISLMDRNPSSKTYGCFDRVYWLDKAIDFPSANIQYSSLALAYVYKYDFEGSIYYKNKQLLSWIEASMIFWTKIQNSDESNPSVCTAISANKKAKKFCEVTSCKKSLLCYTDMQN